MLAGKKRKKRQKVQISKQASAISPPLIHKLAEMVLYSTLFCDTASMEGLARWYTMQAARAPKQKTASMFAQREDRYSASAKRCIDIQGLSQKYPQFFFINHLFKNNFQTFKVSSPCFYGTLPTLHPNNEGAPEVANGNLL